MTDMKKQLPVMVVAAVIEKTAGYSLPGEEKKDVSEENGNFPAEKLSR